MTGEHARGSAANAISDTSGRKPLQTLRLDLRRRAPKVNRPNLRNYFGRVGGEFRLRPRGPLRFLGRQFEPVGPLRTRKLNSAKNPVPTREGPLH
jgi:hypothetical protein